MNNQNSGNLNVDYYFSTLLVNKPTKIDSQLTECMNRIFSSPEYLSSKPYKIKKAINELSANNLLTSIEITKSLNSILTEEDYELDYYKMKIFMLIETNSQNLGFFDNINDQKIIDNDTKNISHALNIVLNEKNEIYIENEMLSIADLKIKVKEYELKFKSESIITLDISKKALYSDYISLENAIKEAIEELRNELSLKTFNKSFEELTEKNLKSIKKTFPIRVIEK